ISLRPGGEGEKAPEELMIARFFALLQQWLRVIGIFDILESIVASGVAGNELVTMVDAQPIRRGFERKRLAGVVGRDGVAVGLENNAKLPRGPDLRDRGDIERMQRQGPEIWPLFVPCLDRL